MGFYGISSVEVHISTPLKVKILHMSMNCHLEYLFSVKRLKPILKLMFYLQFFLVKGIFSSLDKENSWDDNSTRFSQTLFCQKRGEREKVCVYTYTQCTHMHTHTYTHKHTYHVYFLSVSSYSALVPMLSDSFDAKELSLKILLL